MVRKLSCTTSLAPGSALPPYCSEMYEGSVARAPSGAWDAEVAGGMLGLTGGGGSTVGVVARGREAGQSRATLRHLRPRPHGLSGEHGPPAGLTFSPMAVSGGVVTERCRCQPCPERAVASVPRGPLALLPRSR